MTFSPRFSILLGILGGLCVAGISQTELLLFGCLASAILFGLAIIDFFLIPQQSSFVVVRRIPRKLVVGHDNPVILEVENLTRSSLRAILHDEPPDEFQMRDVTFDVWLTPREKVQVKYIVHPKERGDYEFRDTTLVCRAPFLGLILRHYVYEGKQEVKVYPNFKRARQFELLTVRRRLFEAGVRSSKQYGMGTEFESLRDYTPDDDYRRISWTATARAARPMTMQYESEKSQHVMVVIDSGRLMGTEAYSMSRLDHAVDAALMLSHVSTRKGDRAGLLIFSNEIKGFVQPGKSPAHLGLILESLYNVQSELVESDYARALDYLQAKHKRRSLVVVFTEIIDSSASQILIQKLTHLSKRHLVVCVLIKDHWLDDVIHNPVSDHRVAFKKAVAAELVGEREKAIGFLQGHGIHVVNVLPNELTVEVLNKYILIKNKALL